MQMKLSYVWEKEAGETFWPKREEVLEEWKNSVWCVASPFVLQAKYYEGNQIEDGLDIACDT